MEFIKAYEDYKSWWWKCGDPKILFEEHINNMDLHEFIETIVSWSDNVTT